MSKTDSEQVTATNLLEDSLDLSWKFVLLDLVKSVLMATVWKMPSVMQKSRVHTQFRFLDRVNALTKRFLQIRTLDIVQRAMTNIASQTQIA